MYLLSVLCMFKNESTIIKEWIEHYISEGIDHFYLIDNGSTDDYHSQIKDYTNLITLVVDPTRLPKGTQRELYNKHFFEIIKKETEFILPCDIDEYVYSRNGYKTIKDFLEESEYDAIWIPWKLFGTNGISTPNSIVQSLTKRKKDFVQETDKLKGMGKTITRTSKILMLNLHQCKVLEGINFIRFDYSSDLNLNHYKLISEEYYKNVKCIRGGGNNGLNKKDYSMEYFREKQLEYSEVKDKELKKKKIEINIDLFYLNCNKSKLGLGSLNCTVSSIENIIKQFSIKQLYVSECLLHLESRFFKKYNLIKYHNIDEPSLFFGIYKTDDQSIIKKNTNLHKFVIFGGSDFKFVDKIQYINNITFLAISQDIQDRIKK